MECIIPGLNLKILAKAIQALSKVGDELFLEAKKDRVNFVTVNATKTVCERFQFLDTFFSSYDIKDSDEINFKIHMKVIQPLFKGHLEKKFDFYKLEYENNSDFIVFKMKYCCDDILMIHKLRLMENETLTIGINIESDLNNVCGSSTLYNQLLAMFNTSDDEITLEFTKTTVVVRNYCVGAPCRPKTMRSQINLNPNEFNKFTITNETTINFSLRPFRTAIHFAEAFNLDIGFHFNKGGRPLAIYMKNPTFEVHFIVATLDPYNNNDDIQSSLSTTVKNATNNEKHKLSDNCWSLDRDLGIENDKENCKESVESLRTKKAKIVFGSCYDTTFHENMLGEVLVENSDSD